MKYIDISSNIHRNKLSSTLFCVLVGLHSSQEYRHSFKNQVVKKKKKHERNNYFGVFCFKMWWEVNSEEIFFSFSSSMAKNNKYGRKKCWALNRGSFAPGSPCLHTLQSKARFTFLKCCFHLITSKLKSLHYLSPGHWRMALNNTF